MAGWTLYTYPSCTSCRSAEAWLERSGTEVKKVHIYDDPPPREVLERIAASLPGGAEELVAKRSRRYQELGLKGRTFTNEEWLRLIEKEPRLLRRPILWDGERAIVGFSREAYKARFPSGE